MEKELRFRWHGMRKRVMYYPSYKGVQIDPRWDTFQGFVDNPPAGRPYERGLCLCRTGDEGDYTPENCRWDTKANNVREQWNRGSRGKLDEAEEVIAILTSALGDPLNYGGAALLDAARAADELVIAGR